MMICETCKAEGKLDNPAGGCITVAFSMSDVRRHGHDTGAIGSAWVCQNGHYWRGPPTAEPCWCGWPDAADKFVPIVPTIQHVIDLDAGKLPVGFKVKVASVDATMHLEEMTGKPDGIRSISASGTKSRWWVFEQSGE